MNFQSDILKEVCHERGITFESLSYGYVMSFAKNGVFSHVIGSYWDLNNAASDRIACDKSACSSLLINCGISTITHELLWNPLRRVGWAGERGTWSYAADFFKKHENKIVIKPNHGTQGEDVYLCESLPALEAAAQVVFTKHPDATMSPYHEIANEYRVFYLNGVCRFAYGKAKAETSWQHNLSQGARAFEIEYESGFGDLKTLAKCAATCIGITFATIDIAELKNGDFVVMEINSGILARHLLEQLPHLKPIIKSIFGDAIDLMLSKKMRELNA